MERNPGPKMEAQDLADDADYAASQQQVNMTSKSPGFFWPKVSKNLQHRTESGKGSGNSTGHNGSEVVYAKDNVSIHPTQYAFERINGRLRLIKQGSSLFMTWIPYKQTTTVRDGVARILNSKISEKDRNLYTIRAVPLAEVRSIRRHTPPLGWQYIIIVLTSGLAFPPLYFYNGGVREFLGTLKEHAFLVRSAEDANVFLVNDIQDPLQKSLSSLELPGAVPVANSASFHIEGSLPSIESTEEKIRHDSHHKHSGGLKTVDQHQRLRDPARDISIHVLEKFSLVTKFARETTAQLFGENRLLGSMDGSEEAYVPKLDGQPESSGVLAGKSEERVESSVESQPRESPEESVMGDTDSRTDDVVSDVNKGNSLLLLSSGKNETNSSNPYHVCRHCNRAFSSGRALGGHMRVHGNGTANGHSSCALNKSSKAEFSSDQIGDYSSTDISKLLLKKSDVPKSRSNDNHNWVQADSEEEDQQDDCKSNEENDTSMDVGQELSNGSAQKMLSLYTLRRNPKRNSRLMDREFSMELTARNNNSRVCTQCGKEFSSSKALFGHMRCHPDRDWRGIQPPSDNTNTDTDNNCAIVLAESSGLFPAYWQNSLESEDLESPVQKSGFVCEEKREQVEQASDNESDTESMKAAYQQPAYNFLNWSVTAKRGRRKPIKVTQTQDDHGDAEEEPEVNTKELEEDRDTAYFLVMLASSASNNNKNYDNGHGPVEIQLTEESVYDSKTQQAGKRESQGSIEDLEGGEEDQGWKGKSVKEIKKRKIGKAGRLAEGGETGNFSGEKQLDVGFAETAGKYKCSTCKKLFNSHQALGGHRASHRKVKGCFAMTNVNEEGQELAEEEITEEGTLLRIEYPSTANDLRSSPAREEERANLSHLTQEESLKPVTLSKKAKGHECSICHKVFPSGQALGGHKRCHWTGDRVTETASSVISTEKQPKGSSAQVRNVREQLFDLNEPAPVEEEDLEAAYGMVDVVPACADSVNKRVKMLEAVTNTGFRYVQCNICGHLFTSMECLRTHQMVHALMPSSSSPSQL